MRYLKSLACAFVLAAASPAAASTSISIANASFEDPVANSDGYALTITGWGEVPTSDDNNGFADILRNSQFPSIGFAAPDGQQMAYVGTLSAPAYIWQDVETVQGGATYELSAIIGHRADADIGVWRMQIGLDESGVFTPFATSADPVATGTLATRSLSWVAPNNASGQVQVRFESLGGGQFAIDSVALDRIDPVGGVPEPTTWAMMLAGVSLLGWRMRRRASGAALSV